MRLPAVTVVALILAATPATAGEITYTRTATAAEMAAIWKVASDTMKQAEAMPPVTVRVGTDGKVTAFRIESQAICGSGFNGEGAMSSCPTLVYRGDLDHPPIWRGMAGETLVWPQAR